MRTGMGFVILFLFLVLSCAVAQENALKTPKPADAVIAQEKDPSGSPAREEKAFIDNYIENLHYMVYIDDKIKIAEGEEYVFRKAIASANDWLASKNMQVVLLDQVESLKRDHDLLVEDSSGENLSVVQWLAQKLNADVYVCIDVMVASEKRGNQYFAQAVINLTVFEAATGRLLGSKSYNQLDKTVGNSAQIAKTNAVQICVSRIMEDVIKLTQASMYKAVEKGIRYELFLLDTRDAATVLSFIDKLKAQSDLVKNIESVYRTDSEGKFFVYYFGKPDEFERLVYKIARTVPGLGGIKLVSQRGKSFTFKTGM